jgi:hypothetical protein
LATTNKRRNEIHVFSVCIVSIKILIIINDNIPPFKFYTTKVQKSYLFDGQFCASVGRISETPSDTVKYLTNYYQHFMLSSGWRVPGAVIND